MAEYTDDLALIVRYDGTKADFDDVKNNYLGKVVFIYGSKTEVTNQAGLVQAIWVSDANGGRYLDMANVDTIKEGMTHIAGLATEGTVKTLDNGANGINFKGANGISITFNPSNSTDQNGVPYWNVEISGQGVIDTIKGVSTDGVTEMTLYGVKNYALAAANTAKNEVIGKETDTESSDTIKGAKKYADKVKTDLEGTSSDTKDSATIAGAKKYADDAVAKIVSDGNDAAADDTIKGAKKYTDEAKSSLIGKDGDAPTENTIYGAKAYADTKDITIDSTNTDDTLAGKFVIKKNGIELATINIPKELVVKSGQVVVNPSGQPAGTYIELTIQNQDAPLYINVADLVDAYTAEDTSTINITISTDNKISASVKGDSIETSMLKNSAVTTAKIADANVTTDKIADGAVSYDKLDQSVKTSLGKADNAVTDVGVSIPTDDADYLTGTKSSSGTIRTINLDVKTETIENATSDATKKGLATAEDVAAYLKARLSVKVVS